MRTVAPMSYTPSTSVRSWPPHMHVGHAARAAHCSTVHCSCCVASPQPNSIAARATLTHAPHAVGPTSHMRVCASAQILTASGLVHAQAHHCVSQLRVQVVHANRLEHLRSIGGTRRSRHSLSSSSGSSSSGNSGSGRAGVQCAKRSSCSLRKFAARGLRLRSLKVYQHVYQVLA
jgi:hypothetical protein